MRLAADIRRYLDDEPVVARPPTRAYRFQTFVRRNRVSVIAAALVLLAMAGGVVGTSIGLIAARTQSRYAKEALARAIAAAEGNERARKAEAAQRSLAEQANRRALDALMSFTDDLMGKLLGGRQRLDDTELSILRNAQRQWESFALSKGESAEARMIRADGAFQLARVQERLGLHADAVASASAAAGLRERLAAEFPDEPLHQSQLAAIHNRPGLALARRELPGPRPKRMPDGPSRSCRSWWPACRPNGGTGGAWPSP